MFSAYVEIGVTASSSRSRSRAPRIVSAPRDERQQGRDAAAEDDQREHEEHRKRELLGVRQVLLDLAIDLGSPDRRASGRGPRHGRESHRHSIGGLPPARFGDACSRVGRDERGTAVAAVERRCVLREERLRLDDALDAREPSGRSGRARARAAAETPRDRMRARRAPRRAGSRCPARRSRSRRGRAAAVSRDRMRRRRSRRRARRPASREARARPPLRTAR